MNLYRFEVQEEIVTPIEVTADNEQEARERVFRQDSNVTPFDTFEAISALCCVL